MISRSLQGLDDACRPARITGSAWEQLNTNAAGADVVHSVVVALIEIEAGVVAFEITSR